MKKLQVVEILIYEGGAFGRNNNLNEILTRINPDDIKDIKITKSYAYIFYYSDLEACSKCEALIPKSRNNFNENTGCPNKCEHPHCEFCGELLKSGICPNECNSIKVEERTKRIAEKIQKRRAKRGRI